MELGKPLEARNSKGNAGKPLTAFQVSEMSIREANSPSPKALESFLLLSPFMLTLKPVQGNGKLITFL